MALARRTRRRRNPQAFGEVGVGTRIPRAKPGESRRYRAYMKRRRAQIAAEERALRRTVRRRRLNPGPYPAGRGKYSFDTGRTYKYSGLTRHKAALLMEKRAYAETHGLALPKPPRGHTWADVAVVLHYGPDRLRKKRKAAKRRKRACACPPRRRRAVRRRAAPRKRRAVRRRRAPARRRRTTRRALPAPRRRGYVDQIDYTRETFGR